jgi:hypothetical protein
MSIQDTLKTAHVPGICLLKEAMLFHLKTFVTAAEQEFLRLIHQQMTLKDNDLEARLQCQVEDFLAAIRLSRPGTVDATCCSMACSASRK